MNYLWDILYYSAFIIPLMSAASMYADSKEMLSKFQKIDEDILAINCRIEALRRDVLINEKEIEKIVVAQFSYGIFLNM